ncbi:MAG: SpoIIE family protein phosphatase [Balneolaceae bacterium]|nr:SpoIIE family protein phosphatase [Balneolaceae bacterium]
MLIEARDSDFVLENLLFIVMGKLLTTKAAIILQKPSNGKHVIVKQRGIDQFGEGDEVTFKLNREGRKQPHIHFQDQSENLPMLNENMDGTLFFPLRTSNHHLGYLFVNKKANDHAFTDAELEFVESLCIISSVAIANSQLIDELKGTNRKLDQRIHELNTLFDLSKEFNLLADRDKITRIFKFALLGQLFVRTFFLIYKTPDEISLLASSGMNEEPAQSEIQSLFEECPVDIMIPEPDCIEKHPFLDKNRIAYLAGVSIQGDKVAVVGVGKRVNGEPYTETDYNFLNSLANLAVVTIQKTFFLEERIDKERIEEELSIAKSIQTGLMPNPIPETEGLDLAAITISSREVGGDYFDVVNTPDGSTLLAIGDVTGKGVPAAMLMANLQSMLHVLLPIEISLADATGRINELIHQNTPSNKFITFFWGKYSHSKRRFRYVNAGHNPPLLLRKGSDTFEELSDGGLLLGAMQTLMPYTQTDIFLDQGDLVVGYTDGVNEAMNPQETDDFGEERLKKTILKNRNKSASEIQKAIIDDVNKFAGQKLDDDLTLIIFRVS